jgi:hypothetical protein
MFTSSTNTVQRGLAKLTFTDGKTLVASVKLSVSGKLMEAFNGPEAFVDVIAGDGTQFAINKSVIARAETIDPPKAALNQLRRASDKAGFNPYAVLGIDKSATPEDTRKAYLALVKQYHPDLFAGLNLPQEMKDYAAAMQARINMAFQQLEG